MRRIYLLLATAVLSLPLLAQPPLEPDDVRFRYGFKLGVQTADSFNNAEGFNSDNSRFAVGGVADMRFNDFLGAEFDVMYRQYRFDALIPGATPLATSVSVNRAHALDFPVLAKLKPWGEGDIQPFVSSGVAFRYINANETRRFFQGDDREASFSDSFAQDSSFNIGWVLAGGVNFNSVPYVTLAPELRYTVWFRDNFRSPATIPGSPDTFTQNNNQFEILLGFIF